MAEPEPDCGPYRGIRFPSNLPPMMSCAVPTLAQVYEGHAADFTRAAEQTDDPVFRNMLLTLALQWRLASREETAMQSAQPKAADRAR